MVQGPAAVRGCHLRWRQWLSQVWKVRVLFEVEQAVFRNQKWWEKAFDRICVCWWKWRHWQSLAQQRGDRGQKYLWPLPVSCLCLLLDKPNWTPGAELPSRYSSCHSTSSVTEPSREIRRGKWTVQPCWDSCWSMSNMHTGSQMHRSLCTFLRAILWQRYQLRWKKTTSLLILKSKFSLHVEVEVGTRVRGWLNGLKRIIYNHYITCPERSGGC